jgi:hypothetical protein
MSVAIEKTRFMNTGDLSPFFRVCGIMKFPQLNNAVGY